MLRNAAVSPFVQFPIFPPYRFWLPEVSHPLPMNVEVYARLEEIDPAAQPFTSVYYCHAFLRWYAITAPRRSFEYNLSVHPLETLLLWSFVKKKPLVELRADDIDEVMRFYVAPPSSWSAPPVAKYLESYSASAVVGDEFNKATLDQFRRSELGRWSFSIVKGGDWYEQLPVGFNPIFENLLRTAGVNTRPPLPSTYLFPKLFRWDGLTKASIAREIIRFRKGLVEAAQASDDPEIQLAVNLYKNLSFSLVRRSAKMLG